MNDVGDFSQFKRSSSQKVIKPESKVTEPESNFKEFYEFKRTPRDLEDKEGQEIKGNEALRHIARTGSRVLETVAGLPGDIHSLAETGANWAIKSTTGKNYSNQLKIIKSLLPGGNLPTSSQIKENAETASKGYLAPQTKGEEISDEITSDIASFLVGPSGKSKIITKVLRAIGISALGQGAKETAKSFGLEESSQELARSGTMFLASMINPKGALKYTSNLYTKAEEYLPKDAKVSASNLSKDISKLVASLEKGISTPAKNKPLTKLKEIKNKIKMGNIEISELEQTKKDLNQLRSSLYADFKGDKAGLKSAKRNFDNVSNIVNKALEEYGEINPQWFKIYKEADNAFGAIAQSKKVSRFIFSSLKKKPFLHAALLHGLFGLSPGKVVTGGAAYGAVKSGELLHRVLNSPVLRKYYTESLKAASREDAAALTKHLASLDKALDEEGMEEQEELKE